MTKIKPVYAITDKMPVNLIWQKGTGSLGYHRLSVEHPGLSSQDIAALAGMVLLKVFQKDLNDGQVAAEFARLACDGTSVPACPDGTTNSDFIVGINYASTTVPVGDKDVRIPRLTMTAYRPTHFDDGDRMIPLRGELDKQCRGVLELTISHGIILVTEHRGWLGSNEIIAYLRKTCEAAVQR